MVPGSNYEHGFEPRLVAPEPFDTEDAVEALRTYQRIRGWLLAIPDREAGVLQAAYETRPWPKRLFAELGPLTGVVVRLACARDPWPADRAIQELLQAARAGWLDAECAKPIRWSFSPIVKLRREAEERVRRALGAYAAARGPGLCIVRSA